MRLTLSGRAEGVLSEASASPGLFPLRTTKDWVVDLNNEVGVTSHNSPKSFNLIGSYNKPEILSEKHDVDCVVGVTPYSIPAQLSLVGFLLPGAADPNRKVWAWCALHIVQGVEQRFVRCWSGLAWLG